MYSYSSDSTTVTSSDEISSSSSLQAAVCSKQQQQYRIIRNISYWCCIRSPCSKRVCGDHPTIFLGTAVLLYSHIRNQGRRKKQKATAESGCPLGLTTAIAIIHKQSSTSTAVLSVCGCLLFLRWSRGRTGTTTTTPRSPPHLGSRSVRSVPARRRGRRHC